MAAQARAVIDDAAFGGEAASEDRAEDLTARTTALIDRAVDLAVDRAGAATTDGAGARPVRGRLPRPARARRRLESGRRRVS
jgi:hypothetical protein